MNDEVQAKPIVSAVPLAEGLRWRAATGVIFEEKLDGVFKTRKFFDPVSRVEKLIAGELLRDGRFYGFDLLAQGDEDLRPRPLRERLRLLDDFILHYSHFNILRPARGVGGEFLEAILSRGGEGVVRKDLALPYSVGWQKCKRVETVYCVVTGLVHGTQSAEIARMEDGGWRIESALPSSILYSPSSLRPCGRVALLGGKRDRVRVGSVLKLNAFGVTAKGMLREPRVDTDAPDSWLVKF